MIAREEPRYVIHVVADGGDFDAFVQAHDAAFERAILAVEAALGSGLPLLGDGDRDTGGHARDPGDVPDRGQARADAEAPAGDLPAVWSAW